MAKYVPDVNTKRWIVIAAARKKRPDQEDYQKKNIACVLCPGNEGLTPPEVYREGGGEPNKPGWKIRVVPNLFPITDIHEVIIHSPEDKKDIEDLDLSQVVLLIHTYRHRYQVHEVDGQVMIFCNHGEQSGASLTHPHSQLVVLPRQISLDALEREPVNNLVLENTYFNVYCPEFSQWPYEVWIAPKSAGTSFGEVTDSEITDLAEILQKTLQKLCKKYEESDLKKTHPHARFSYNFYIYHGKNWYLRIIPRFIHRAGFELGTGLNVNIVDPTVAAEELKLVEV